MIIIAVIADPADRKLSLDPRDIVVCFCPDMLRDDGNGILFNTAALLMCAVTWLEYFGLFLISL